MRNVTLCNTFVGSMVWTSTKSAHRKSRSPLSLSLASYSDSLSSLFVSRFHLDGSNSLVTLPQRLFPLCEVSDVLCGFYVTDDGRVNPVDATAALAKGAKMNGVKIFERTSVTGVTLKMFVSSLNVSRCLGGKRRSPRGDDVTRQG